MSGRHCSEQEHSEWHLDQFVAAPVGWRIVCLNDRGAVRNYDLAGWLVQEEVAYAGGHPVAEDLQPIRPVRRVVAATHVDGQLVSVHDGDVADFWRVSAPHEDLSPNGKEIRTELERREKIKRHLINMTQSTVPFNPPNKSHQHTN